MKKNLFCLGVLAYQCLFACASIAHAEPIVTAIIGQPAQAIKPNYLIANSDDDGYIAITGRVSLPPGLSCVTPTNLRRHDNFFSKNYLEIVLFANVEGFQGVDPKQPIPITAFKFDDSTGKYCAAPFALPVTLVPNHRFGRRGPTGAPEPKITITMLYTAKGEELITPIVTSWINVAAAVSTGGAAQTVIGIQKIASNKAIGTLTEMYHARTKNRAEQKFTIDLPWSALLEGPTSSTVSFYESSTKWGESVENGIARIRKQPRSEGVKTVFDLHLNYEYRRSLFIEDQDFSETTKLPKNVDSRLSSASVLNFPAKDAVANVIFPNLMQVIGSSAPSIPQGIAMGDASKCDAIFVTLRSLGLNSFDRSIVADALLDDPKNALRTNSAFIEDCFSVEKEAFATLIAVYGASRYPISPTFVNHSLVPVNAHGKNTNVDPNIQRRLSDIRAALTAKLTPEEKANVLKSVFGASAPLAWGGDFATSATPLDSQIASVVGQEFASASCFYRLDNDPGPPSEYRAFMFAKIANSINNVRTETPYLLVLDFEAAKPYALRGLQMRSVTSDDTASTHFEFLKAFTYSPKSTCSKILA